jgi:hypothetical protein
MILVAMNQGRLSSTGGISIWSYGEAREVASKLLEAFLQCAPSSAVAGHITTCSMSTQWSGTSTSIRDRSRREETQRRCEHDAQGSVRSVHRQQGRFSPPLMVQFQIVAWGYLLIKWSTVRLHPQQSSVKGFL